MTDYTPEKVADLIAEALRPMTDLDVAQRPEVTRAFIRRLGVALKAEHKRAERYRGIARRTELQCRDAEREAEGLRAVIEEALEPQNIGYGHIDVANERVYRILSRITDKEQGA